MLNLEALLNTPTAEISLISAYKKGFRALYPVGSATHHTASFKHFSVVCSHTEMTKRHLQIIQI